jgi:hypothetical protein
MDVHVGEGAELWSRLPRLDVLNQLVGWVIMGLKIMFLFPAVI